MGDIFAHNRVEYFSPCIVSKFHIADRFHSTPKAAGVLLCSVAYV